MAYETISPLYLKFNDVILSMINKQSLAMGRSDWSIQRGRGRGLQPAAGSMHEPVEWRPLVVGGFRFLQGISLNIRENRSRVFYNLRKRVERPVHPAPQICVCTAGLVHCFILAIHT